MKTFWAIFLTFMKLSLVQLMGEMRVIVDCMAPVHQVKNPVCTKSLHVNFFFFFFFFC